MFKQCGIFWLVACCLSLGLAPSAFAAPSKGAKGAKGAEVVEVARVTTVSAGAFVERGTVRTPLKVKDALYKEDTISTDAKGKVGILFADNTTIDLAPDSTVNIADFSFGGTAKANFAMGLFRGVARVVTGQLVKQNPDGFNINTPHATVGIRGTVLTADVRNTGKTLVILTDIGTSNYVGVFNIVTRQDTHMKTAGFSCEIDSTGNVLRPSTPAELQIAKGVTP